MMYEVKIRKVIHDVIKENEGCSLNYLYREIKKRIKEEKIGIKRLKSLILRDNAIKVIIHSKKGNCEYLEKIDKCVVCGSKKLINIYKIDLKGDRSLTSKKCSICGFEMKRGRCGIRKYEILMIKSK